jgi:hypothetical protein
VSGEAEDENQVDRSVADDLVGDRRIAGLGVLGRSNRDREPNRIRGAGMTLVLTDLAR